MSALDIHEWAVIIELLLTFLIIPALGIIWSIKGELIKLSTKMCAQEKRLDKIEEHCERQHSPSG
jgi:hypothetical protein